MQSSSVGESSPSRGEAPRRVVVRVRGWALKNNAGELFAYKNGNGMRFHRSLGFARFYRTEVGAKIARGQYRRFDNRELTVVAIDHDGKHWDGFHHVADL